MVEVDERRTFTLYVLRWVRVLHAMGVKIATGRVEDFGGTVERDVSAFGMTPGMVRLPVLVVVRLGSSVGRAAD